MLMKFSNNHPPSFITFHHPGVHAPGPFQWLKEKGHAVQSGPASVNSDPLVIDIGELTKK